MHGFLELIRYCKKFVKNYGKNHGPLNSLLKYDSFISRKVVEQSLSTLKDPMCNTLVLIVPNFLGTFVLECGASGIGIRMVFMQEGNPLNFTIK
jgi:hypothetical protein